MDGLLDTSARSYRELLNMFVSSGLETPKLSQEEAELLYSVVSVTHAVTKELNERQKQAARILQEISDTEWHYHWYQTWGWYLIGLFDKDLAKMARQYILDYEKPKPVVVAQLVEQGFCKFQGSSPVDGFY